ncbi:MAG: LysE family translocator [Pseudomonadota bacterium]
MDFLTLFSFALLAGLLVISPGPNGVLIAKTVPTSGRAAGFANAMGFLPAFLLHGALSIFGISILLLQSPTAFWIAKLAGAAYLCWIGINALVEAFRTGVVPDRVKPANRKHTLRAAFAEGFLTNLLNPKVSMFYLAAFPQFIPLGENAVLLGFALVVLHCALNLLWFSSLVVLLDRMMDFARSSAVQRWVKGITGFVFIGFAVKLATLRP